MSKHAITVRVDYDTLDAFLAQSDPISHDLPAGLAMAANQALRGIDTVQLQTRALLEALKAGGLPCTLEQFSQRFTGYVHSAMTGHDARNTRLTIDE